MRFDPTFSQAGDRDKLIGLDPEPARLYRDKGGRAEGLLQQERLVVDEPVGQLRRSGRVVAQALRRVVDLLAQLVLASRD